jgi:DNA-binding MarR family transcriptional regulator
MIAEYHEATRTVRTAMQAWTPVLHQYRITRSMDTALLLYAADRTPGLTLGDFERRVGCVNSSYVLKGLVKAGVITQGPGRDERSRRLTLTDKGREVLAKLIEAAS